MLQNFRICLKVIAFVVLLSSVVRVAVAQEKTSEASNSHPVSIVSLLTRPATGQPQHVTVAGFLVLDFESEALYLHKEDYDHRLTSNAIRVAITEEQREKYKAFAKKYVWLDAYFVKRKNSSDYFVGALFDIKEISEAK